MDISKEKIKMRKEQQKENPHYWTNLNERCFKKSSLDDLAWIAIDAKQNDAREAAKVEVSIRHIEEMNRNSRTNTYLGVIMTLATLVILWATLEMANII